MNRYAPLVLPGFKAAADEPLRRSVSLPRAKEFLDSVNVAWARQNKCGTCHTNLAYLAARPFLGSMQEEPAAEVRESLYTYLDEITSRAAAAPPPGQAPAAPAAPRAPVHWRIPTVSMLAVNDGESGSIDPRTLAEFDRVWTMQKADGSWDWPTGGRMLPFIERDNYYVAMLVALGAGYLPASYLETPAASTGLQNLRRYLTSTSAADLHDDVMLLWASARTAGLMNAQQKSRVVDALVKLQRPDGGWSLPSLGRWKRHDGPVNDPVNDPSDGYATGFVTFALCQPGTTRRPSIERGLRWLETHQRESGRWYTRSLYSDMFQNYLSNMGTAYAVMALRSCRSQ